MLLEGQCQILIFKLTSRTRGPSFELVAYFRTSVYCVPCCSIILFMVTPQVSKTVDLFIQDHEGLCSCSWKGKLGKGDPQILLTITVSCTKIEGSGIKEELRS